MMLPDGRPVASTPTTLAQILLSSNAAAPATAAVPLGSYATPPPAPLLPAAPLLPMLPVAAAAVPVNTPPRPRAAYIESPVLSSSSSVLSTVNSQEWNE